MSRWEVDFIGQRGESVFAFTAMQPIDGDPVFRATPLGAKFPTWDFLLEAIDVSSRTLGYCFVQVRTTSFVAEGKRLNVRIDRAALESASRYPGPTYLVGVELGRARCYLVGLNETPTSFRAGLSTETQLNEVTLRQWWNEVTVFWSRIESRFDSCYKDPEWYGGRQI